MFGRRRVRLHIEGSRGKEESSLSASVGFRAGDNPFGRFPSSSDATVCGSLCRFRASLGGSYPERLRWRRYPNLPPTLRAMSHHSVVRICVEGEALNGVRETHSTLVIVPTSVYERGLHHQDAFSHARAVGLEPPYRVLREYRVAECIPTQPRPRGRRSSAR